MASLYKINEEIARLQDSIVWNDDLDSFVDLDTGEIMTDEQFQTLYDELQMDKQERLEWMAKCVINDRGAAEMLKTEIERLKEQMQRFQKRAERFEAIIERECGGQKTDLGVATMSYRKSEAVVFEKKDIPDIVAWLEKNEHDECLKYADPEIRKDPLKKLIKSGVHVPLAMVEQRVSGKLK